MGKINNVQKTNYTNKGIWIDRFGRSGVGSYEKVNELYNRLYVYYENGVGGMFDSSIKCPDYSIMFFEHIIDIIPAGTTIYETMNNGLVSQRYYSQVDENQIVKRERKIIANGIVGYVFTKLNPGLYSDGYYYIQIPEIGTAEFYQYFFDLQFEHFKKGRADGWRDDLIDEFLLYHLEAEHNYISQSEELFTYFPIDERQIVMQYVDNYLIYIKQKYYSKSNQQTYTSMNYFQILLSAITEHREQKTPYKSLFKREAQKNLRDNFVEFEDFFAGCIHVVESYKKEILKLYNKALNEDAWVEQSILSGKGMIINGEHITDLSDERLIKSLFDIKSQREYVESKGSKNYEYICSLSKTGEITSDVWEQEISRQINWQDVELIESEMLNAKNELFENELPESFNDFFHINKSDKIETIIQIIEKELISASSKALCTALITIALQNKNYIAKSINITKYHKALASTFGSKVGSRARFNEKYSEINLGSYEAELKKYTQLFP